MDILAEKEKLKEGINSNGNSSSDGSETDWVCPKCATRFGKDSMIHGRPAIKLVGGKTTMTKK